MAILDRLKWESPADGQVVWKWPSDNLRLGAQLIVGPGQEAIFVKGGQAFDVFESGTHTLSSNNLPLLGGIVNWVYGGETPFSAEVWFVIVALQSDARWGTAGPIQVVDPVYRAPVSIRAHGQYSFRINDTRSFLLQIVGSKSSLGAEAVLDTFRSEICETFSQTIAKMLADTKISVFDIASRLDVLASTTKVELDRRFDRFGIELAQFNISRVSIPEEELATFRSGLDERIRIEQLNMVEASETYRTVRHFDAMDNIADTEGGGIMFAHSLLGRGAATDLTAPPASPNPSKTIEQRLAELKRLAESGLISAEEHSQKRSAILDEL